MKLKNYFQIGIGAGLVMALIGSVVWYKNGYSINSATATATGTVDNGAAPEGAESGPDVRLEEDLSANVSQTTPEIPAEPAKQTPVDLNKASESFASGMKAMSACFNITTESADRIDPTYENLLKSARPGFGEPIMNSTDWIVWSLHAASEDRRIRVETDYSDSSGNTRNLRYFKIEGQGTPSIIPLPAEQTKNPTDAFIASLQKDGTVYREEKGLRGYFENGQELTATEKDGKVDDLEITNGGKTFHCSGILTTASTCKCN